MLLLLQVSSPGSGPPVPMSQAYQDGSPMPVYGMWEWCLFSLHSIWLAECILGKQKTMGKRSIKKFCMIGNTARTNLNSKKVEDIKMLTVICYNSLQYPGRT